VTDYLAGLVWTALVVVPLVVGVRALRGALLPGWQGPPAWVADSVAITSIFLVAAQVTGAVGQFSAPFVGVLCAAAGIGCRAVSGRVRPRPAAPPPASSEVVGGAWSWLPVAVVAVTFAPWLARSARAVRFGMGTIDSLWYHLPAAARFVQTGRIFDLQSFDGGTTTFFYPEASALFHGFGMSAFHSDLLSPLINLVWLALTLLAGWCIGRPKGLGLHTMTGAALISTLPVFLGTQPGGAYTDQIALAFALCAVALLLNLPGGAIGDQPWVVLLSACAVGVVLGTKWSGLIGVAALTLTIVVLASRGRRLRTALIWVAGVAVTGGSWYIRNLVDVHNPLPPIGGSFGPLTIPKVPEDAETASILHFLFDGKAWRANFLPGLGLAFGVLWPVVVVLVVVGLVLAIVRGPDRLHRALGVVGLVVLVGYVVQPQFLTLFGRPVYFYFNLRYPAVGLVFGLVLLPVAVSRRLVPAVLAAYVALLLALQTDPTTWPTGLRPRSFAKPIESYAVVAGVVGGVLILLAGLVALRGARGAGGRKAMVWGIAALGLAVAVVGYPVQRYGLDHRYTAATAYEAPNANRAIYRWAQGVHDARIALAGDFFQYPLTGLRQSNYVQYLVDTTDRHVPKPVRSCRRWRQLVNEGRFDYVVTAPVPLLRRGTVAEEAWTAPGKASEVVLRHGRQTVFRLRGPLDPDECPPGS
jgi:hypothetical protein